MVNNHFTATGIVFNNDGKVLMIKHKALGVWLPPGGHLDENELPCDAVVREIFEETGVKARVISMARGADSRDTDSYARELALPMEILFEDIERTGLHNHIDMIYLCDTEDSELKPQESEINGIGWFSPEQVSALETYDNVRHSVKKAVRYKNG